MNGIGGYFELELGKGKYHYHDTPYVMKSGRSSLHLMLSAVKPVLVYIPFYTCDALLAPFEATGIKYAFYAVNEHLEPENTIVLKENEYFLYVNYLGLKGDAVARLSALYKDKLIVDCTQAFFMKGNGVSWFFNSCRKYFGVPDGGYLYAPAGRALPSITVRNEGYITDHLLKRLNGHVNDGYEDFLKNEQLVDSSIYAMSKLSELLLSGINYDEVIQKRLANYEFLHSRFKDINLFNAAIDAGSIPMYYPLLLNKVVDKELLFARNIFIATLWKDTRQRGIAGFDLEKNLTDKLLPLPVDHRYSLNEMELVAQSLKDIIQ